MTSKSSDTTSSGKHPSTTGSATGYNLGSPADIHAFLNRMPHRMYPAPSCVFTRFVLIWNLGDNIVLPQSPWAVSSGYYTRPDGTVMYIEHQHQFRETTLSTNVSSSMKRLPGGCKGCNTENGGRN